MEQPSIQLFRERLSAKNRTRQCRKVLWVMAVHGLRNISPGRCFSDIKGNSSNKCIYVFSLLVEPQSVNANFFYP